jgi:hypothetical protein
LKLSIASVTDYFTVEPEGILPKSRSVDWSNQEYAEVKVRMARPICELERRRLEAQMLPRVLTRPSGVKRSGQRNVLDMVTTTSGTPSMRT